MKRILLALLLGALVACGDDSPTGPETRHVANDPLVVPGVFFYDFAEPVGNEYKTFFPIVVYSGTELQFPDHDLILYTRSDSDSSFFHGKVVGYFLSRTEKLDEQPPIRVNITAYTVGFAEIYRQARAQDRRVFYINVASNPAIPRDERITRAREWIENRASAKVLAKGALRRLTERELKPW